MKNTFEIYEDIEGQLIMFVFREDTIIFAITVLEEDVKACIQDIDNAERWVKDPYQYKTLCHDYTYYVDSSRLIADSDCIYFERMNRSGRNAFRNFNFGNNERIY